MSASSGPEPKDGDEDDEKSSDQLREEGRQFADNADVEEVGNPGGNPGDEEEYVTQQWALQDKESEGADDDE